MIERIDTPIPEGFGIDPNATIARTAAVTAVASHAARVDDYVEHSAVLLATDPASLDLGDVLAGGARAVAVSILQDELQARRLVDGFLSLHQREAQDIVNASSGTTSEILSAAHESLTSEARTQNRNKLSALETRLRSIVRAQLAV
ncbi:hypothetical protein [Planctomicrobium piriforme]|uniref:Uncharacterized protein n=1 Tax=Planctomicrobium piriforme TaxID=1576369 RepID=A0A1I3L2A7_9PLAN|nr:hypothetical protein [Planctomicrobium piriforme]SFI78807.1 hypothetical protein SAMN05421753_112116 [Planctomicrobium piriforme]